MTRLTIFSVTVFLTKSENSAVMVNSNPGGSRGEVVRGQLNISAISPKPKCVEMCDRAFSWRPAGRGLWFVVVVLSHTQHYQQVNALET